MGLFDPRDTPRPHEYPFCQSMISAFQDAAWTARIINYKTDRHDYDHELSPEERELVRRATLLVALVECKVKLGWSKLAIDLSAKPEVSSMCAVLAASEVVHEETYGRLTEEMGIPFDMAEVATIPEVSGRIKYLKKHLNSRHPNKRQALAYSTAINGLVVEGISLFPMFYVIKAIQRRTNKLNGFGAAIDLTANEEFLHSEAACWIVKTLLEEYPETYDDKFVEHLERGLSQALPHEERIVDWLFGGGELPYLGKEEVKDFVRLRFNKTVESLDMATLTVPVTREEGFEDWFTEQCLNRQADFFHTRPADYSAQESPVTVDDLF